MEIAQKGVKETIEVEESKQGFSSCEQEVIANINEKPGTACTKISFIRLSCHHCFNIFTRALKYPTYKLKLII